MATGLKKKNKLFILSCSLLFLLAGCESGIVSDINTAVSNNSWISSDKVQMGVEIKDISKTYSIYFKLRVTAEYRYANIYILSKMKGPVGKEAVIRYGYKLAEADGQWLGKGSGNLYTYKLPLLTNYKFLTAGKYQFSIEQNMRDNPLRGISDLGLVIEEVVPKQ